MLRFRLLGSVDLRHEDGREVRAVLAQPKRLALLAYLAAASPAGSVRRDTLLGMFWPELDEEHARNALSKAVHFLRHSLGEAALVSRSGDELALGDGVVWVDVREFRAALDGGRPEEALELYRGDLLPSFYVTGAPAFEEWLERERAGLRARAATAARTLAERHEHDRHLTLAAACARRAVELSNDDERPLRRLIELLDRLGDRSGAVRAYEEFARRLASELQIEPSAETVALVERIKASPTPRPAAAADPRPATEPASPIERLRVALADHYKIERQLGAGAMAVVALAHDRRHRRRVAIKILRPELASLMGADRFLREIDIAAGLMHPHILPLHDSGEADGLLYYVMPYVEGESLRGRLEREGRLPMDEAVRIAGEVADALAYAHHRGFVHRDIKPENILLSAGHALVADFGIARAIGSAGREQPAAAGLSTGTPAYMSPEQATGLGPVDERTDVYALGCVLYEMLAGEPPFAGTTPEHTIERRLLDSAPAVSATRSEAGLELDAIVARALVRDPAERYATARELGEALGRLAQLRPFRRSTARNLRRVAVLAATLAIVVTGALALSRDRPERSGGSPEDLIAILPFRALGPDTAVAGLGEGMVDLLATRLASEAGPPVVDPRNTLAAWRRTVGDGAGDVRQESALEVAEGLGAGRAIVGSIVGAAGRLTLSASLLAVPGGGVRSRSTITGGADSLMLLVDRLTAELLSLEAGEGEHRLATLTSTSLPALRAYLEGQAAYRRFQFDRAREQFERALALDSTFALAALGLHVALNWGHTRFSQELIERTARLAWTHADRLSSNDRLRLRARLGARYPAWTPPGEQVAFVDSALVALPHDPEMWQIFGYLLFFGGSHLGIPDWRQRSTAALHRAIGLDSAFLPPRNHLVRLAVGAGDTSSLRGLTEFYVDAAPAEASEMIRWLAFAATPGEVAPKLRPGPLESFTEQSLRRVVTEGTSFGLRLEDAERAMTILLRRSASGSERERTLMLGREFFLNRGRPAQALGTMRELMAGNRPAAARQERLRELAYYALYWDGDEDAGRQAVGELERLAREPLEGDSTAVAERLRARCVVEQWNLAHGDRRTVRRSLALLRDGADSVTEPRESARSRACAALLQAMLASAEGRADVLGAVDALDSLHMAALPDLRNEDVWVCAGNLVAGRLRAAHGDVAGALTVLRRHGEPGDRKILLSTYLREEGRLAALAGDTARAVRAYRHFLDLRSRSEPRLAADSTRVREELRRLTRASQRLDPGKASASE